MCANLPFTYFKWPWGKRNLVINTRGNIRVVRNERLLGLNPVGLERVVRNFSGKEGAGPRRKTKRKVGFLLKRVLTDNRTRQPAISPASWPSTHRYVPSIGEALVPPIQKRETRPPLSLGRLKFNPGTAGRSRVARSCCYSREVAARRYRRYRCLPHTRTIT